MLDLDAYREAFDIHGETVECCQCGAELDILSVQHWARGTNFHGEEDDAQPLCDACYWDSVYRDEDDEDNYDWEM